MNVKAVFLDIDGTFFDHTTNQVLPQTLAACRKLKDKGFKVALCSGRPKEMADQLQVFDMLDWDGYVGCAGGVVMNEHYEIIDQIDYTQTQMEQMFHIAKEHGLCMHSFGKYEFMTEPMTPLAAKLLDEFHLPVPEIRDWRGETVCAVSVISEREEDFRLFEGIDHLIQTASAPYCRDFIRDDVNKAVGIRSLMRYWQLPETDYLAFGDSLNDLEMLREAQIGVAMGNAHPMAKEAADIVCAPSYEPGIWQTLEELHLL